MKGDMVTLEKRNLVNATLISDESYHHQTKTN
jgi:hypothetical protein